MKTIKNIISNILNFITFCVKLVWSLVSFGFEEIKKKIKDKDHQYQNMATMRQKTFEEHEHLNKVARNDWGYPSDYSRSQPQQQTPKTNFPVPPFK